MNNQRGFTLSELLVAMAVVGLVMGSAFTLQQQGQNAYLYGASRTDAQQKVRGGLERFTRDLRSGSAVTAVAGANDITFSYLQWQAANPNGVITSVRYYINGTSLLRNEAGAANQPETVISDVQALAITYYDVNGVVTAVLANVRNVQIRLTTQVQSTANSPAQQSAVMETRVRMRNL